MYLFYIEYVKWISHKISINIKIFISKLYLLKSYAYGSSSDKIVICFSNFV